MTKYINYDEVIDDMVSDLYIASWDSPYESDDRGMYYDQVENKLEEFETIEITKCKDCKHNRNDIDGIAENWCYKHGIGVEEYDYCSYGESKE